MQIYQRIKLEIETKKYSEESQHVCAVLCRSLLCDDTEDERQIEERFHRWRRSSGSCLHLSAEAGCERNLAWSCAISAFLPYDMNGFVLWYELI